MKRTTVGGRIIASFSILLGIFLVIGIFVFFRLEEIRKKSDQVAQAHIEGLILSLEFLSLSTENYIQVSHYLILTDKAERTRIRAELDKNDAALRVVLVDLPKTIISAEGSNLLAKVLVDRQGFTNAYGRVLELVDSGKQDEAETVQHREVDPAYQNWKQHISDLVESKRKLSHAATDDIHDSLNGTLWVMSLAFLGSIVLVVIIGALFLRSINEPVKRLVASMDRMRQGDFTQRMTMERSDEFGILAEGLTRTSEELMGLISQVQTSAIQVNTSTNEIAATAKEHQATANEVATSTTEIGATSKEISATSQELVKTVKNVASSAEETATLANNSQSSLTRMEVTMKQILDATSSINSKLAILSEKAGNITSVVSTINKVADQTNLLSLNAAIEAEKAGEAGRGFAVVASEIRRLADQTAVATSDIEQIVKEMQSAVSAGVMGMDKFSEEVRRGYQDVRQITEQLSSIIQQVQGQLPSFEVVQEGVQAQSIGAQQISEALMQLSESAQQTSESLRQSNMAIEQLNQAARGLQKGVSRFKLQ